MASRPGRSWARRRSSPACPSTTPLAASSWTAAAGAPAPTSGWVAPCPLLSSLLPLWLPWVRWRIAVLPEAHPEDADADAPERFAARVQQQVAAALGVAATDYSMHEAATVIPAVAAALERAGMRDAIPSKYL